nr:phospholipase-like protein [Tanacetum cinerariifolium]
MRFGTISFCLYTSADLKFRNRVFPHKVGLVVTNLDILGVIEDEVMFGNLCDEDSVRLCLILALEVIYVGRLLTCLVDDYLFGLVENLEAWNDSKTNTDIRPTRAEYQSSWWIESNVFFKHHVPKPPEIEHHPLFQAYLSKLEKSRKRLASSFRESSSVCTRDNILKTRRLTDRVIRELNVRDFKLETIIQVLALERNDKLERLQFNKDLSRLRCDFVESLNILFQDFLTHMIQLKILLIRGKDSFGTGKENSTGEEVEVERREDVVVGRREDVVDCRDLWVDYMWHGRSENAKWTMVSCYFVQLLMQNNMPLFYANNDKYGILWSDVDQLYLFALSTNSLLVKDMMVKVFEIDNERDLRTFSDTYAMCQQLHVRCHEWREQMLEMQSFLHVSTSLAESYKLLEELQDFELEKCRECLPVILEGAKVFDKKGIHPSNYTISFKLAHNVPKQGDIYGDCGVWDSIFLYRLAHGLSLDVKDPVDVVLAYREKMTNKNPENYVIFEVNYDGVFNLHPLSTPRSILEEGLTIIKDDFDMNKMYEMGEKYSVANELGLHDNWLYEGLSLDGPIDVGGQVVLNKKKGRSMIKVTRKRKHHYYKKINRFRKVYGKRVSLEADKGRLGGLVALNDHEVDDDPQLKSQV